MMLPCYLPPQHTLGKQLCEFKHASWAYTPVARAYVRYCLLVTIVPRLLNVAMLWYMHVVALGAPACWVPLYGACGECLEAKPRS